MNICEDYNVLKAIGIILKIITVAKISIPLIIIVMGTIDYYKATISGTGESLKKYTLILIKRIIAAFIVFAIPTILTYFLSIFSNTLSDDMTYNTCINNATDSEVMNEILEENEKTKEQNMTEQENRRKQQAARRRKDIENAIQNSSNNSYGVKKIDALPYINQGWYPNLKFCQSTSIKSSGCGVVSLAMVAKGYSDKLADSTNEKAVTETRNILCDLRGWNTNYGIHSSYLYNQKTLDHLGLQAKVLFNNKPEAGFWSNSLQQNESELVFNAVKKEGKSVLLGIPGHWVAIGPNSNCGENQVYMYDPSNSKLTKCYTMEGLYSVTYNHKYQCNQSGGMCGWAVAISFWNA